MGANIQFKYVMKDGTEYHVDGAGVNNVLHAAFEIACSILNGYLDINRADSVRIEDIPG